MFKCCISSFGSTRSGFFGRADVTAGTSACTQCQMCQMGASAMPPTSRMTSECHTMKKCGRRRSNLLSCLSHLVPLHPSATTAAAKLFLGTRRHMKFMPTWRCVFEASFRGRRSKRTASNHCILSSTPLAYSSLDVRFQLPARSRNATPRYVVAACRYNALHAFVLPMLTRAVSDGCLTAMHCSVYAQVTRAACNQGLGHGLLRGTPYG